MGASERRSLTSYLVTVHLTPQRESFSCLSPEGKTLTEKHSVLFLPLSPEGHRRLSLHELFESDQHHLRVLFRMLTCLLGRVIVLRQRDVRLIPVIRQFNIYCVVVLWLVGQAGERAEMGILNCPPGFELENHPLSSYDFPCHSPLHLIGLPSRQSVATFVPNMYCLMAAGFTNAS